jgi:hypothetical protein
MALVPALAARVAAVGGAAARGSSAGGAGGGGGGAAAASAAAQPPPPLLDARASEAALRGVLSVAMNLSHQNPRGSEALLRAGALPACASLLSALVCEEEEGGDAAVVVVSRRRLLRRADLVGVALGVVINVASSCGAELVGGFIAADGGGGGGAAAAAPGPSELERVLVGVLLRASEARGGGNGGTDGAPPSGSSASAAAASAEASIVEAYAAIALGFLVVGDVRESGGGSGKRRLGPRGPALLQLLADASGGGGGDGSGDGKEAEAAARLALVVRRCLAFYVRAGAITEASRVTMATMLMALEAQSPEA